MLVLLNSNIVASAKGTSNYDFLQKILPSSQPNDTLCKTLFTKKFFLFQNEYFGFSELVDDDQKDISHMIHLVVIAICFWIMDRQVSLLTITQFSIQCFYSLMYYSIYVSL